jgi:hypothetical protein
MGIAERLGVTSFEEVDPDRPLEICGLVLGPEAASVALEIVQNSSPSLILKIRLQDVDHPDFFELYADGNEKTWVMKLPNDQRSGLPTAVEIALVHALHAANDNEVELLKSRGCIVSLGNNPLTEKFSGFLEAVGKVGLQKIKVLSLYKKIQLTISVGEALNEMDQSCLAGYTAASPMKFEFVELYRLMEARYLAHIRNEFNSNFMKEPKAAIGCAAKSLESEILQLGLLSERAKPFFELVYDVINLQRNSNRFAAALCKKLDGQASDMKSPKHKAGAAFVYYIRCAIVHAGGKDMIFESYSDSDALLYLLKEHMEEAAFALAGLELRT